MSSIFSTVPKAKIPRSNFNLSHEVKLTCEIGKLVPFLCREVVPGDKWRVNSQFLCRFAPMLAPIMHNVNLYTHFFFVPNRLIYKDWEDYITGGQDGTSTPVAPFIEVKKHDPDYKGLMTTSLQINTLADYLGLPCTQYPDFENNNVHRALPSIDDLSPIALGTKISALPFAAYQLIYDQYYRDETLDPEHDYCLASGEVDEVVQEQLLILRNRSWRKDYFTSALPWPQRGQDIVIPFGDSAPIIDDGQNIHIDLDPKFSAQKPRLVDNDGNYISNPKLLATGDFNLYNPDSGIHNTGSIAAVHRRTENIGGSSTDVLTQQSSALRLDPNGSLVVRKSDWEHVKADLRSATGITINDFRRLVRVQVWLERNARGGARYTEQLRAHFSVLPQDARLQRAEYLGGGRVPLIVSEVLQNSAGTEQSPQGNMSGHGMAAASRENRIKHFFPEHGFLIGILSILPTPSYQQGIERMWSRVDKLDYYFPEFANLGEQEIKTKELFAADGTKNEQTFGYAPRYSDYKYIPSSVHGDFRTNMAYWHLGRIFRNAPALNSDFIHCDEHKDGLSRIFAVETSYFAKHCWLQIYNDIRASRPMPKFGVPKII